MVTGISVKDTGLGIEIRLDGDMFRRIALDWEQGKIKPFYTLLKAFIRELEKEYNV